MVWSVLEHEESGLEKCYWVASTHEVATSICDCVRCLSAWRVDWRSAIELEHTWCCHKYMWWCEVSTCWREEIGLDIVIQLHTSWYEQHLWRVWPWIIANVQAAFAVCEMMGRIHSVVVILGFLSINNMISLPISFFKGMSWCTPNQNQIKTLHARHTRDGSCKPIFLETSLPSEGVWVWEWTGFYM